MHTHYPGLVLTLSTHEAHLYEITPDGVEKKSDIMTPKDTYSDNEGQFGGTHMGGRVGSPDVHNATKDHQIHAHIKAAVAALNTQYAAQSYAHIVIILPEEYKNYLQDELPNAIDQKRIIQLYGNHTHANTTEIAALYHEALTGGREKFVQ